MLNRILNLFRKQEDISENEKKLRVSGKAIYFSFDDCVIKSFKSTEEDALSFPSKIKMLDGLAGRGESYQKGSEICYIICEIIMEEKQVKFVSPPLPKNKTVLTSLLYEQGGVNVFVDPANLEVYFFDLNFLK